MKLQINICETPSEAYEVFFFLREYKDAKPLFWEAVTARAQRDKNERLLWYLGFKPSSGYERMVALELMLNYWNVEADSLLPEIQTPPAFVPRDERYFWDMHSFRGAALMIAHWRELASNTLSDDSPLDLRWSGSTVALARRHLAFQKFGSMFPGGTDWKWSQVEVTQDYWRRVLDFDSSWYRSFYARLAKRGLWPPRTIA